VFVIGLLLLAFGLVGAFFAIFPPVDAARGGAVGVALGCGLSGALLAYLDAPGRRRALPPGQRRAKATILEAAGTPGSVAGYQMVELTLEVSPKGGVPFQVKRKFSAGRLGRIEPGRRLDVVYDPANPEQLDLA
jgi:hypothetical protein